MTSNIIAISNLLMARDILIEQEKKKKQKTVDIFLCTDKLGVSQELNLTSHKHEILLSPKIVCSKLVLF